MHTLRMSSVRVMVSVPEASGGEMVMAPGIGGWAASLDKSSAERNRETGDLSHRPGEYAVFILIGVLEIRDKLVKNN